GKVRSGPEQLAAYLMRTDDGERATLLELQYGENDLRKALIDWDAVGCNGTRSEKTLYHAQIAWETKYQLTKEECLRSAQILAEDLGMANHPRAVVLHDGGDKPHLHVVFMRADIDTMTMWQDYKNYVKHERASFRMEKEFGHDLVPGKHKVKRDRKKQPEFPRAESSHADHQQAARTEMSLEERKAQIVAIRQPCDDAHAFKNALEEAGYVLARGDRRGFVLVDADGEVYSLSKHLAGDIKGKAFKEFMAPIDPELLPTVDDAKELQRQHSVAKQEARAAQEQHEPVAKSDGQPEPQKQPEAATDAAKAKQEPSPQPEEKGIEASKFFQQQPPAKPAEPAPPPVDEALEALKKSLADRQAKEMEKWADLHAFEQRQFEFELDKLVAGKTADFDAIQQQERNALKARHAEKRKGIKGILDAIENRWNPTLAAEKTKERRRETALLKRRQEKEREDYLALLEQNRQLELENLKERQALRLQQEQRKHAE